MTVALLARRPAVVLAFTILLLPFPFVPVFNHKYNPLQIKNSVVDPIEYY